MRFPKTIKHRKAEATIYGRSKSYPFYRVAYHVDGHRRMKSFSTYSEARQWAEEKVRELASSSKSAALTARQADEALIALRQLESLHMATN